MGCSFHYKRGVYYLLKIAGGDVTIQTQQGNDPKEKNKNPEKPKNPPEEKNKNKRKTEKEKST